jgi:hypothetical protein
MMMMSMMTMIPRQPATTAIIVVNNMLSGVGEGLTREETQLAI